MSYILDALKKLEHEKTQKIRKDGIAGISGVLFDNDRPTPARTLSWKIALAVLVAVLVTFTVTWQFLQSGKVTGGRAQLATPAIKPPPVKIETAPLPVVPSIVPAQNTPQTAQVVVRPATSAPAKIPKPQAPVKTVTPTEDPASLITLQELRKRQISRKGQTQSSMQMVAAPADIKLSGIAYQDERRARRAVVNGFLVQEGGVVSGAVITDIFQDRVRFSLAGSSFELSLVSSGVSASGK